MKTLDRTLAKEIKAANGDESREAKFSLLHKIHKAVEDMSTPDIAERFMTASRFGYMVSPPLRLKSPHLRAL